ncbi:unnamed protein product [Rotaria sordida]|uniref:Uncharacterized protein n=1 Tax=Rotaria sordida TaxID=392033 RepID=A0A813YSK6_9BILA|nr:unnamed protein product [Rotaria sordida]
MYRSRNKRKPIVVVPYLIRLSRNSDINSLSYFRFQIILVAQFSNMVTGDRTWHKTIGNKHVQSQDISQQNYTQNVNTIFDDGYEDDDDQENEGNNTCRAYSSRSHVRPVENRRFVMPPTCHSNKPFLLFVVTR